MSLPTLLALHGGVQGNETAAAIWHQLNPLGGSWLPEHVTVRARKQGKGKARVLSDLVVSERWQGEGEEALWVATGDGRGVRAVDGEEAADDAGGGRASVWRGRTSSWRSFRSSRAAGGRRGIARVRECCSWAGGVGDIVE